MSQNFKKINILELIEKSERNSDLFFSYSEKVNDIKKMIEIGHNYQTELFQYSIIGMITCIEVCIRDMIAELIDYDNKYFKNLKEFGKISFDFEFINALNSNKLTVGQFIANTLPLSSFESIVSNMDKILGEKFLEILEKVEYHEREDRKGIILKNPNKIYKDINKIFNYRHICVHEFVSFEFKNIIKASIDNFYESFSNFICALEHILNYKIYPTAYMTQTDMNIASSEECTEISKEIENKVNNIKSKLKKTNYLNHFIKSQDLWVAYSTSSAEFVADFYKGGSIWSLIYSNHLSSISNSRLQELEAIETDLNDSRWNFDGG